MVYCPFKTELCIELYFQKRGQSSVFVILFLLLLSNCILPFFPPSLSSLPYALVSPSSFCFNILLLSLFVCFSSSSTNLHENNLRHIFPFKMKMLLRIFFFFCLQSSSQSLPRDFEAQSLSWKSLNGGGSNFTWRPQDQ